MEDMQRVGPDPLAVTCKPSTWDRRLGMKRSGSEGPTLVRLVGQVP